MENDKKIQGGAIMLARKVIDSDIFTNRPDLWFKIWIYLLAKATHCDKGNIKRGQCFMKYEWVEEATKATHNQVKHCIDYLKRATQIATQKTSHGMIITIVKYDYYQKMENYSFVEKPHKKENKSHTEATPYNKNDKNDKNEDTPQGGEGSMIPVFIDLFKKINPTYQHLFGSPPQRKASERLIKLRPIEEWSKVIDFIINRRSDRFCPRISTPVQLEQKYADLETYAQGLKGQINKNNNVAFA